MKQSLFALLLFVGVVFVAQAQVGPQETLVVSIFPQYPKPYQTVTVSPQSYLIDLAASTVTITVNGEVQYRGSGNESAAVTVGGPGTATTITVTVTNNGQTYSSQVVVRPADVALLTESASSAHPFYKGASLVATEGRLRLIAVPDLRTSNGTPIAAENLVYTWRNGEQVLQTSSGIGKSVLTASSPVRYRDTVISVTVSTQDNSIVGQAATVISPVDPLVRVYESDPLLGPRYETALADSTTIADSERTYRAVAYHFGTSPTLTWEVNGTPSQTGQDITVRPSGGGSGSALLRVLAESVAPRQVAESGISVTYGQGGTGIFGL